MGWVLGVLIFGAVVVVVCTSWGKEIDHQLPEHLERDTLPPVIGDPWPALYDSARPSVLEQLRVAEPVLLAPTLDPVSGEPRLSVVPLDLSRRRPGCPECGNPLKEGVGRTYCTNFGGCELAPS